MLSSARMQLEGLKTFLSTGVEDPVRLVPDWARQFLQPLGTLSPYDVDPVFALLLSVVCFADDARLVVTADVVAGGCRVRLLVCSMNCCTTHAGNPA